MNRKSSSDFPQGDPVRAVLKALERVQATSHNGMYRVFEDWLELTEAVLESLPAHAASAAKERCLAEDTPATQALFQRLRAVYPRPDQWDRFAEAIAITLDAADGFWQRQPPASTYSGYDILGGVYMATSYKPGSGQFFTPWAVANMMGQIIMADRGIEQDVLDRLNAAGRAVLADPDDPCNAILTATTLSGLLLDNEQFTDADRFAWLTEKMLPYVLHRYDPVRVLDPCCGSGVMFLAGAFNTPAWIVQSGLVQFYGMDIDQTCVRMARCNVMIYGLNGSYVQSALALSDADLQAAPQPYADAYRAAQEAARNGQQEVVEALADAVRQQQTLFDLDAFRATIPTNGNGTGKRRLLPAAEPALAAMQFEL